MGSSPVAFNYLFRFASFFVFILDFVHNWIHLFEFGMRLCNKYSTENNFNKPKCDFTFACWIIFETFVIICWLLIKINFFQKYLQEHYQSVKWSISRSEPTFCWYWTGSKLFANCISWQEKSGELSEYWLQNRLTTTERCKAYHKMM